MKILSIDTSTQTFNIAVVDHGKMMADYKMHQEGMTHSEVIIPALKNILQLMGLGLKDLEGIAVSVGPGSFTGLRIGLATAKGLAFSLSVPIVGINTLESYAFSWQDLPGILCPMIKARKDQYYYVLYQKSSKEEHLTQINTYQCKSWNVIKKELLRIDRPIFVFGYGLFEIINRERDNEHSKKITFISKQQNPPGAKNMGLLAEKRIQENQISNLFTLSPLYICESSAQIKTKKRTTDIDHHKERRK